MCANFAIVNALDDQFLRDWGGGHLRHQPIGDRWGKKAYWAFFPLATIDYSAIRNWFFGCSFSYVLLKIGEN
jgi:hypothetical protein